MATFRVEATFRNPDDRERSQSVSLLVGTGVTWTTLPRDIVDALGCSPVGRRGVRFANGPEEAWPITIVLLTLEAQELPAICLIAPPGRPSLLGTVTRDEFALTVDPVDRRLVPVASALIPVP